MSNCILCFPNHTDGDIISTVAFSKGMWRATQPLENLQDPFMYMVARSTSASNESTKFDVDLGGTKDVRVVAIPDHNMSLNATIRVRGSNTENDFSNPVVDSGYVDIFNEVYAWGNLYWGHPSLWYGKLDTATADGYRQGWHYVFNSTSIARYWRFEIQDQNNEDGYIQLSRLVIAPGWQPQSVNISYGSNMGFVDPSKKTKAVGGTNYIDRREVYRTARLLFRDLEEDEALEQPHEIMRELGTKDQLYFIWDPDDIEHRHRRSFLATMRTLTELEYPYFDRISTGFNLEEVI